MLMAKSDQANSLNFYLEEVVICKIIKDNVMLVLNTLMLKLVFSTKVRTSSF